MITRGEESHEYKIPDYVVPTKWIKQAYSSAEKHSLEELKIIQDIRIEDITLENSNVVMRNEKLRSFLNHDSRRIVDLGIGVGLEILGFKNLGWSVVGYDYSATAIAHLKSIGITSRTVDLNAVDHTGDKLSYQDLISEDLSDPCNIFSMHVLEYLEKNALTLLLFCLLNTAKPNTVFFFTTHSFEVDDELDEAKKVRQLKKLRGSTGFLERNYAASFFSPRTDVETLFHINKRKTTPVLNEGNWYEEILVMRKLGT